MERVDLGALEAALAKATPGPWRRGSRHDYVVVHLDHGYIVADEDLEDDSPERVEADTDAIISAHNALPALIAELRELREEAERARWCEENRAAVWLDPTHWKVSWVTGREHCIVHHPDRSAAIDAARGGGR